VGAAPLVLLLVGMMVPAAFIFLAIVFDELTAVWVIYRLWHDEWSVSPWQSLRRIGHVPQWHPIHHH
jgi:hypothetical protein